MIRLINDYDPTRAYQVGDVYGDGVVIRAPHAYSAWLVVKDQGSLVTSSKTSSSLSSPSHADSPYC